MALALPIVISLDTVALETFAAYPTTVLFEPVVSEAAAFWPKIVFV